MKRELDGNQSELGTGERTESSGPEWVPAQGWVMLQTGVHFDAVRVVGLLGEMAAEKLAEVTKGKAGPIVIDWQDRRWGSSCYFLVAPGSADPFRWPPGIRPYTGPLRELVAVPAPHGRTFPYEWLSRPTAEAPFVLPEPLHAVLCELTEWQPLDLPAPTPTPHQEQSSDESGS
ncbi:hypothetical protein RKE29_13250 [Streptomyces sp. B1866]|uniref:hypothetical protein n=1 Tax=Streptomyces sp. B1866 TaxID=3075431 RepID=UPI00288DA75C|nr:hypothetical protein [Streptomyces sp. B1866]MDT3397606.1 hypothetical protein [Streptomyces sp. B1866]